MLESIYAAYTIGSNTAAGGSPATAGVGAAELASEALYLGRLVVTLQPHSAEAHGLLALMLFCQARRPAQFNSQDRFVPLLEQDTALWSGAMLAEAERCLWQAAALRQPGGFQLEAAIQSAHCQRAYTGQLPWGAIVKLYEGLILHHPGLGARIGHAAALAFAGEVDQALAALRDIPAEAVRDYQPYWVALAHMHRLGGDDRSAREALRRALGLTEDVRIRAHLAPGLCNPPDGVD